MIVEINDGQFEVNCHAFSYSAQLNGFNLIFIFIKLPDIIRRFSINGVTIKRIKTYMAQFSKYKKYIPSYKYAHITKIIYDETYYKVYMTALKIDYPLSDKKRSCFNPMCISSISYLYVMPKLLDIVDDETANNIWNSKLTEFYCCYCYNKKFNKMRENEC